MGRRRPRKTTTAGLVARFGALALLAGAAWTALAFLRLPGREEVAALARTNPTRSALMQARLDAAAAEGRSEFRLRQRIVPLGRISPWLRKAVVLAEDQRFWMHDGVDWGATREAVEQALRDGRLGRGGSTITQQLAKNLFLSEGRSIVRKAAEWRLAGRLDDELTKQRILELYLNYAEWGEGLFGAEEAARLYFGKSAAQVDAGEAAVLAAMLPSPLTRDPRQPTANLRRRAHHVARLMARVGLVREDEVEARVTALVGRNVSRTTASK